MAKKIALNEVEREIYSKRSTVRYDIRDLTVESISNKYDESLKSSLIDKPSYNHIYIPEYQRDFTWDIDRQSKLIESIILGLPIPFIFVAENKNSAWEIVDGSQRIRTIHAFLNNKLCLQNLKSIKSLNGYKFCELEESRQGKILNTALRIIVLSEETTDEVKMDMFERINRGSDLLKPMEKRKGIYVGPFSTFIYEYCSKNHKFKELIKLDKWLEKRQEYEELLLRFFAISDDRIFSTGLEKVGIAQYLDNYLQRKNSELLNMDNKEQEETIKEYSHRIDSVVDYVDRNFPFGFSHTSNPQTKRSVFEAISVGVWLALRDNKASDNVDRDELTELLNSNSLKRYTHTANETHKKKNLTGRIEVIYKFITSDCE